MATTNIFDQGFSNEVVFDRVVDTERTISLARQAADKAEASGQNDRANKLRAKADHLEQILQNTLQNDAGLGAGDAEQDDSDNTPDKQETRKADSNAASAENNPADSNADEEEDSESAKKNTSSGNTKKPDDLDNLNTASDHDGFGDGSGGASKPEESDEGNGNSASGDGADGNNNSSNSDADSDEEEGNGDSKDTENKNSNNADGDSGEKKDSKSKGTGRSRDIDPFRLSAGNSRGQSQQVTPEEELEAIIRRLSKLTGKAKAGADRGLQDFFSEITGGDSL